MILKRFISILNSRTAAIHSKELSSEVARIDLLRETNTSDEVEQRNNIYFEMFKHIADVEEVHFGINQRAVNSTKR